MSRVAAPSDRRFRRAHLKPSRRRGQIRSIAKPLAKHGVIVLLAAFVVWRGGALVGHAGVLQIDRIRVRGNQWLTTGEVHELLDRMKGEHIIRTDLHAWRERLLASPWVQDASLRRMLPSTVDVVVSERMPVCIGRINGALFLVDERGVVIDEYGPEYAEFDLPIVDGLTSRSGKKEPAADPARAELAARLIGAVAADPGVARRISQIDVSDAENAAVILAGDPAVIYLGRDRFLPRLQSYLQLAPVLRERVPDIDYVDLRFDELIYVGPTGMPRQRGTRVVNSSRVGR